MTDDEIIEGMKNQPNFLNSLSQQIGELKNTRIDREAGLIHFFGESKNCSFRLDHVVGDLEDMASKIKEFKGLSFT